MKIRGARAIEARAIVLGGSVAAALFLSACVAQTKDIPQFDSPGATVMSKVVGAYQLDNRRLRVDIDSQTGDISSFGANVAAANPAAGGSSVGTAQPATNPVGDFACVTQLDGTTPALRGYVEARDEQTWEYIGEDEASHTRWRKIYCLDGDRLMASFLCDNQTAAPMPVILSIVERGPSPTSAKSTGDVFTEPLGAATLRVKAFDQFIPPAPAGAPIVWSESQTLAPGERFPWTTVWTLSK